MYQIVPLRSLRCGPRHVAGASYIQQHNWSPAWGRRRLNNLRANQGRGHATSAYPVNKSPTPPIDGAIAKPSQALVR
eukprot:1194016-Prorocentrum_minimum.AAC.2